MPTSQSSCMHTIETTRRAFVLIPGCGRGRGRTEGFIGPAMSSIRGRPMTEGRKYKVETVCFTSDTQIRLMSFSAGSDKIPHSARLVVEATTAKYHASAGARNELQRGRRGDHRHGIAGPHQASRMDGCTPQPSAAVPKRLTMYVLAMSRTACGR